MSNKEENTDVQEDSQSTENRSDKVLVELSAQELEHILTCIKYTRNNIFKIGNKNFLSDLDRLNDSLLKSSA